MNQAKPSTTCLFGIPFNAMTMPEVVAAIDLAVARQRRINVSVVNVAKLVNMRRDAFLRESVLAGDLIVADGMPLVWVSRLVRRRLPQRVAGIDLMFELFKLADRRQLRIFLLGAEDEVLQRVAEIARRDYPNMILAGMQHGYFRPHDEPAVAQKIAQSRADILFVAMTSPRKEHFMKKFSELMNVAVCHGVGGSFDVMAGKTRRAPRWMQRTGLEWLYRVLQEPRRMWKRYLVTNTIFMGLALREIFFRRRKSPLDAHV